MSSIEINPTTITVKITSLVSSTTLAAENQPQGVTLREVLSAVNLSAESNWRFMLATSQEVVGLEPKFAENDEVILSSKGFVSGN